MTNNNHRVRISNLNTNDAWVPLIALWHHNEWLRNHHGLDGRDRSASVIKKKLSERQAALARHLSDDDLPTTFVALLDSDPVGTVSLVYYKFSQEQEATEWLTNLFVLPEYRCRGIASELLCAALGHACSLNLPRLLLYTNDQVGFYQKRRWRSINNGVVQGQKVEIMDYVFPSDASVLQTSVGNA